MTSLPPPSLTAQITGVHHLAWAVTFIASPAVWVALLPRVLEPWLRARNYGPENQALVVTIAVAGAVVVSGLIYNVVVLVASARDRRRYRN